jgi:hypothetical protein
MSFPLAGKKKHTEYGFFGRDPLLAIRLNPVPHKCQEAILFQNIHVPIYRLGTGHLLGSLIGGTGGYFCDVHE